MVGLQTMYLIKLINWRGNLMANYSYQITNVSSGQQSFSVNGQVFNVNMGDTLNLTISQPLQNLPQYFTVFIVNKDGSLTLLPPLSSADSYPIATIADAQNGTSNNALMTPAATKAAIKAYLQSLPKSPPNQSNEPWINNGDFQLS